jgi:hypothetical protein
MRTKTLLCAAILSAGVATSMAQSNVYSLNVVGYYNVEVHADSSSIRVMIANQLHTTNDVLSNVLPGPYPDGTVFFFYSGSFTPSAWDTDNSPPSWDLDFPLPPGTGGFITSPSHISLTFMGEVSQGSLTNKLRRNAKRIVAPVPPVQLSLSQMNLPGEDGDVVFPYRAGYIPSAWDTDNSPPTWDLDFTFRVGEGFFYQKGPGTQTNWVYNFTVQ